MPPIMLFIPSTQQTKKGCSRFFAMTKIRPCFHPAAGYAAGLRFIQFSFVMTANPAKGFRCFPLPSFSPPRSGVKFFPQLI